MLRKKFEREIDTWMVSAFIGPGGKRVSYFDECTVVMVSSQKGICLPHSRDMFRKGTELGDAFTEVTQRFFHHKEESGDEEEE